MNKELLERYKAFLDYMNVDYEADVLLKTSGGNSVVCNMETEWQECLGKSINEVTEIVAKATGKKTQWENEGCLNVAFLTIIVPSVPLL